MELWSGLAGAHDTWAMSVSGKIRRPEPCWDWDRELFLEMLSLLHRLKHEDKYRKYARLSGLQYDIL